MGVMVETGGSVGASAGATSGASVDESLVIAGLVGGSSSGTGEDVLSWFFPLSLSVLGYRFTSERGLIISSSFALVLLLREDDVADDLLAELLAVFDEDFMPDLF
jgi:hypothetical protein